MISPRCDQGVRLPFGSDPAFGDAMAGDVGYSYGSMGPESVTPDQVVVVVKKKRHAVPVPPDATWATYRPLTQAMQDAAEDRAGWPNKLGETLARSIRERDTEVRGLAHRDVAERLDEWAAEHRVQVVIDVDVEGLDEQAAEKAAETARTAALKGLAATAARAINMPGLASRASRLERTLAAVKADPGDASAVGELVDVVDALLDGVGRPLSEDDLDDEERRALRAYRRRSRDIMRDEARQTVVVDGWGGSDHFDRLPDPQQSEAMGHVARMKVLGPPKGGASSPVSG